MKDVRGGVDTKEYDVSQFVDESAGKNSCTKKSCKARSDCSGYYANIEGPGIAGCIELYCM
jgi:hypothetical protein